MSFVRFAQDNSDVYVDVHFNYLKGYVCYKCSLCSYEDFCIKEANLMISHLTQHRRNGDIVPPYVDQKVLIEAEKLAADDTPGVQPVNEEEPY